MKEKINTAFERMNEHQWAIWNEAYILKEEIEKEEKTIEIASKLCNLKRGLEAIIEATNIIETLLEINKKTI